MTESLRETHTRLLALVAPLGYQYEVDQLRDVLHAIVALHVPDFRWRCAVCREKSYPCRTLLAVEALS